MSDDAEAIKEIRAVSDGNAPRTILHYLYVPDREAAAMIEDALRSRGFQTENRLGADGVNWLVLASHEAISSEELITSIRRSMEALVAKVGGEYDGWEADVRHRGGRPPNFH